MAFLAIAILLFYFRRIIVCVSKNSSKISELFHIFHSHSIDCNMFSIIHCSLSFNRHGLSSLPPSLAFVGEWPSGLYSLRQVTEVNLGRVSFNSGWVTSEA